MSLIDKIEQLDKELFLFFNSRHNAFWDEMMTVISAKLPWIPLYAVLLVMMFMVVKKRWWLVLIAIALLITLSDQLSVVLKNSTARYRPCHNLELQDAIHVVDGCGGKFGFVSSHAANAFAIAMFLSLLFRSRWKWFPYFIFPWAALVAYSRIYLGKHYPADIAGGALLGILIALLVYKLYKLFEARMGLRLR